MQKTPEMVVAAAALKEWAVAKTWSSRYIGIVRPCFLRFPTFKKLETFLNLYYANRNSLARALATC
jgi:hypothetical protein